MAQDSKFLSDRAAMMRSLALARRGCGVVSPNPAVGAVITNGGKIVGYGWHRRAGEAHAEIEALRMSGDNAFGGTLYVTLAPCNHFGRTPPCSEAIVQAGISRVVAAIADPNPRVKGGGVEYLREHQVPVELGVLAEQATELNAAWIHWVQTNRPLVTLKLALSLDGKIASASGESQWLSGSISRAIVQRMRRSVQAVLVGSETVLRDDPRLSNRTGSGSEPLRVIVDSELTVPHEAKVYSGIEASGALAVTTSRASFERRRALELRGVEVLVLEGRAGKVDLDSLFDVLGKRGIQSVFCEGGGEIGTAILTQGLCGRLMFYHCPLVIGQNGRPFFSAVLGDSLDHALRYELLGSRKIGPDTLSYYRPRALGSVAKSV